MSKKKKDHITETLTWAGRGYGALLCLAGIGGSISVFNRCCPPLMLIAFIGLLGAGMVVIRLSGWAADPRYNNR